MGSVQCNVARVRIVGALADAGKSIDSIQNTKVQTAANAGLDQAKDGVAQIAKAIFSGDAPPQDSRDQVEAGLTAMGTALSSTNR